MKKGKIGIVLLSAVMLIAILLMAVHTLPEPGRENPVMIRAGEELLNVWTEDGERFFAFLPGYTRFEEAVVLPARDAVALDGRELPLGCEALEPERTYDLTWEEDGQTRRGTLQLLTSGGTATLCLNTRSGSMNFIHEKKGNAERGTMHLYDEAGRLNYSGDLKSIQGRGNSTWVVHDKKPYSLKLVDKADLLGMGEAKDWILLADALDASAMRNKIVYDFAAEAGLAYTPECRWTELYLNGEYAGLYLLCERVEVDPQRVDLTPDGSLVCMDRDIRIEEDPEPYFVTENGQYLQVRESSDYGALKELFQSMENAVLSPDGLDPESGHSWQELIDLKSWVKKYLIEEIFDSYDANFQSQYFYCYETNADSRIYAGPIWDYDASLGNPSVWALNSPRGLFAWRPEAMTGYATPWLHSLYEKDVFREALKEEYRTVFLPLLENGLNRTIREYAQTLGPAFERNRIRWAVESEGVQAEAEAIITYMEERISFLSEFWLEEKDFCILRVREGENSGYYAYYAVEPGTVFEDLPPHTEEDFLGWYREDTGMEFDPAQPITEDINLYPRFAGTAEPEPEETGLKDLLLEVYHYVPAVVLLMVGIVAVPVAVWKSRSRTEEKTGSKV